MSRNKFTILNKLKTETTTEATVNSSASNQPDSEPIVKISNMARNSLARHNNFDHKQISNRAVIPNSISTSVISITITEPRLTPGKSGAKLDNIGLHNIVGFLIWEKWETQVADEPNSKRKVKNPETFRERAQKATEESDKPKLSLKAAGGKVTKPVTGPVGRTAGKIWNAVPFKWLHKPARLIGKILFPTYFRESWKELKQVTWPTWNQSRRLTFAVLIFAVIFGALIAGVDYGLDKLFRNILLK